MAKVIQVLGGPGASSSFGITRYFVLANGYFNPNATLFTTETDAQITYRTSGTLSNLRVYVSSNTENGAIVLTSRINAANGNQTISLTAATTGEFEDTTNSDTISAGDEVCCKWDSTGSSAGIIAIEAGSTHFAASSGTTCRHEFGTGNNLLATSAALYWTPAGGYIGTANTVDTHALTLLGTNCTAKNLSATIATNTYNADTDLYNWIDTGGGGGIGNCHVVITASTTGIFEDTSNTDSLSTGNLLAYYHQSAGRTSGFQLINALSVELETTNKKQMSFCGRPGNSLVQSFGITRYAGIGGHSELRTNEALVQSRLRFGGVGTYLSIRVSSNSNASDGTVTFRINTADTSVVVTVTGSTTGTFSDTSNSATFVTGDLASIELTTAGAAGNWSIRNWAVCLENTDPSGVRLLASTGVGT